MKRLASLAMMLAFAPMAGAQSLDFDNGGVSVQSIIANAKAAAAAFPSMKAAMPTDITRDCKTIVFGPDDPLESAEVTLSSRETSWHCVNYGPPVGEVCTPSVQNYHANAKIVVTPPRVLQAGQKEVFEVCLWGSFLDMRPVSTVYKYSVDRVLDVFQITPQGPLQAAVQGVKSAAQEDCILAMDTDYSCVYECRDGSFISEPNPFPHTPGWNLPFHGCRPSVARP